MRPEAPDLKVRRCDGCQRLVPEHEIWIVYEPPVVGKYCDACQKKLNVGAHNHDFG